MDETSPDKLFSQWMEMWQSGTAGRGEVAHVLFECLYKTGDASYFLKSPRLIQEYFLDSLKNTCKSGNCEFSIPHAGLYKDCSKEVLRAT